jgi:hypothetical protein
MTVAWACTDTTIRTHTDIQTPVVSSAATHTEGRSHACVRSSASPARRT